MTEEGGLLYLDPSSPPTPETTLSLVRPSRLAATTSIHGQKVQTPRASSFLRPASGGSPVYRMDRVKPWYIVKPSSLFRRSLDGLIVVILIYNVVITPFRVSFTIDTPLWLFVLETGMDVVFLLDLGVNFVTAVLDESSHPPTLITRVSVIATRYLKSWFAIDFVSSIPLDLILLVLVGEGDDNDRDVWRLSKTVRTVKLLRLIRLLRLVRISRVVRKWRFRLNINSAYIRLAKLFVVMLVLAHLSACFWFYVATTQGESTRTWVDEAGLRFASTGAQYVGSLYWSLTLISGIGFGDIIPVTTDERIYVIFAMCIGVTAFSYSIGAMSQLVHRLEASPLNDRLDQVNAYMKFRSLPKDLQDEVREYYFVNWETGQAAHDEKSILMELSSRLRNAVSLYVTEHQMAGNVFFDGVSAAFVADALLRVTTSAASPGDVIVREGLVGSEMFLIYSGTVQVVNADHSLLFAHLGPGMFFGELALLLPDSTRSATVIATTPVKLGVISLANIIDVLSAHPEDIETWAVLRIAEERAAHLNDTVDMYTADWESSDLFDLAHAAQDTNAQGAARASHLQVSIEHLFSSTTGNEWWMSLNRGSTVNGISPEDLRAELQKASLASPLASPLLDEELSEGRSRKDSIRSSHPWMASLSPNREPRGRRGSSLVARRRESHAALTPTPKSSSPPTVYARTKSRPNHVIVVDVDSVAWAYAGNRLELLTSLVARGLDVPVTNVAGIFFVPNDRPDIVIKLHHPEQLEQAISSLSLTASSLLVEITTLNPNPVWVWSSDDDESYDDGDEESDEEESSGRVLVLDDLPLAMMGRGEGAPTLRIPNSAAPGTPMVPDSPRLIPPSPSSSPSLSSEDERLGGDRFLTDEELDSLDLREDAEVEDVEVDVEGEDAGMEDVEVEDAGVEDVGVEDAGVEMKPLPPHPSSPLIGRAERLKAALGRMRAKLDQQHPS